MGRRKPKRPDSFKKPSTTRKAAWRDSRTTSNSSSMDAMSPLSGNAMCPSPSSSSLDSESSQFSREGRSSRKRSRVEYEEGSRLSIDLESSQDGSVFCSHCRQKDSEVAKLMEELSIRGNVKAELDELAKKFEEEKKLKEEALARLEEMQNKYEEENRLKDDALNRLSALASSRLRENNANIADLSDPNRPTKLAEQFSELYDNEWTDAFGELENADIGEKESIQFLLSSLMDCFRVCQEISTDNYFENIQRCILYPAQRELPRGTHFVLPDDLKQQIRDFRKSCAPNVMEDVVKVVLAKVKSEHDRKDKILEYKRRCAEICWLMVVQSPPLVLSVRVEPEFNNKEYRDYTRRGDFVDYVVWPTLFLHEGGAVLSKGVAQGRSTLS